MLHAYAHTRSSRLSEIGLINKRAGPAAISFKKTSENGVYVGGAAPAPEPETRPGGKNRKPLYKLIPRGRGRARGRRTDRRINTFPHPAPTTVSFYTCVSRSRVAPPPSLRSIALFRARCGLIASAEKLFSSTLMNNTNGFSATAARQKLLRRMRSSARAGDGRGRSARGRRALSKRVPANCELDARAGRHKFDQTDAFSGITNNPVQYSLFPYASPLCALYRAVGPSLSL